MANTYRWRLYADNNVEKEIVDELRRADMDVLWIAEDKALRRQTDDSFHYRRARELKRYLITHDVDFWDDRRYPIRSCPGLILIAANDPEIARYAVVLLRKLVRDYNPLDKALYLDGIKIRLTNEGLTIRMLDHDTQKMTSDTWEWRDVV